MKLVLAAIALSCASTLALADALAPPTETVITGPEATKVADLMVTGGDRFGTYARGTASVSCVKKTNEANFTCSIKALKNGR